MSGEARDLIGRVVEQLHLTPEQRAMLPGLVAEELLRHGPADVPGPVTDRHLSSADVHIVAYDVLEAAFAADDVGSAIEVMRADLEVFSREDLIRVAMAIAWESRLVTPKVDRPRARQRLERRRFGVMVADL